MIHVLSSTRLVQSELAVSLPSAIHRKEVGGEFAEPPSSTLVAASTCSCVVVRTVSWNTIQSGSARKSTELGWSARHASRWIAR